MHLRVRLRLLAMASMSVACGGSPATRNAAARDAVDRRPLLAEAALPAPGASLPHVDVERLGGGRVQLPARQGAPLLVVLWSTGCVRSREAVAVLDTLHRQYSARGLRTVLLADDADSALVRSVLARHGLTIARPTTPDTGVVVGLTRGALTRLFDRSAEARPDPSLPPHRVQFVAPGFLLVDSLGIVRRRGAITLHRGAFSATLDSLVAPI